MVWLQLNYKVKTTIKTYFSLPLLVQITQEDVGFLCYNY